MLRLVFFFFFDFVWLKEDTLAGICYLYLLCGAKSKMKGKETWGREDAAALQKKNKNEERPKSVYNPNESSAILVEQNNS